jgi:hypothetical protein
MSYEPPSLNGQCHIVVVTEISGREVWAKVLGRLDGGRGSIPKIHVATARVRASASTNHASLPASKLTPCLVLTTVSSCCTITVRPVLGLKSSNYTGATHSFHLSKQVYCVTLYILLSARVSAWSGVHSARWWRTGKLARTWRPSVPGPL